MATEHIHPSCCLLCMQNKPECSRRMDKPEAFCTITAPAPKHLAWRDRLIGLEPRQPNICIKSNNKKQGFGKQLWLLQTRFLCSSNARPSPAVTTRNSDFVQNSCPCSDYGGSVNAILFLICPTFGADLPLGLGRPLLFAGYAAGPDDAGLWWAVPPRAAHTGIQPLCPWRTIRFTLGKVALAGHHLWACHSRHLPKHLAGPS